MACFPLKSPLQLSKSGDMTKNGPIPETKTVLESGECTDHFSSIKKLLNSQSPVKNHPSDIDL